MRIYLYGVGGADQMYRVVKYWCFFNIEEEPITIREIRYQALELRMRCPSIEHLYLIDGSLKLRKDNKMAKAGRYSKTCWKQRVCKSCKKRGPWRDPGLFSFIF